MGDEEIAEEMMGQKVCMCARINFWDGVCGCMYVWVLMGRIYGGAEMVISGKEGVDAFNLIGWERERDGFMAGCGNGLFYGLRKVAAEVARGRGEFWITGIYEFEMLS